MKITIAEILKTSPHTSINELQSKVFEWGTVPASGGVYIAVYKGSSQPKFLLPEGTGGWFKGRNPNVSIEVLGDKWIDFTANEHRILYIGKAGEKSTLRKRIRSYMKFGQRKPVAHWGGRLIWQIEHAGDIEMYWTKTETPARDERRLLEEFKAKHGKLPFANLVIPHG